MKQYNCPDCSLQCESCCGCPRITDIVDKVKKVLMPAKDYGIFNEIPSCCRGCSNHPSNGGSGICHCTLPYFNDPTWTVTCKTLTTDDIYGNIVTTVTRSDW